MEPVRAGFKGAVWKVKDRFSRTRAAKLAIFEDYADRSFLDEFSLAARLEPYPQFARFDDADVVEVCLGDLGTRTFVCFIEEWVEGTTLADFLADKERQVKCSFLVQYASEMCSALSALRAQGLRHDDLHSGNVMLCDPLPGAQGQRVRIVDTGSLKLYAPGTKKTKDDHRLFVDHLVAIHNKILSQKLLRSRDRRFLASVARLLASMLDDDPGVALRDPTQIREKFEQSWTGAQSQDFSSQPILLSPFEYISAEHMADDRLLVKIFAQSCPWLEKVAGPDPCLLTGPRGCGKSTILRWLSLKAHIHKETPEIPFGRIAGFYVSCSADLQNRLGWITTQALAERFQKEIIHYFNLLPAQAVLHTLYLISKRADSQVYWGLGPDQERSVYEFMRDSLQTSESALQGTTYTRRALDLVDSAMVRCHTQMVKGLNLAWTSSESFLGDFTTLLVRHFPLFQSLRISFLVDDFSTHRVPEPVQRILNRVIWERRGSHTFKLSSEKHGAVLADPNNATIDVAREMVEIDCGREYLALDDYSQVSKAKVFAVELLSNRLKAASYSGTPDGLLGDSSWSEGSLARALCNKDPGRKDDQYHGLDCIAALCSGDVSTLLLVYRRIFELGRVDPESTDLIARRIQHEAIESVSRELFEAIKHVFPSGPQMYQIVEAFGRLIRRILVDGRPQKKGDSFVPTQCPRIEVDQGTTAESLTGEQETLAKELVRRAIFIEMELGRSRHDFATTARWQLRRVYLPAFGAALAKNDALKWDASQFKYFLTAPAAACDAAWQRRQKRVEQGGKETLPLDFQRKGHADG